jgi:hypothetical protein
MFNESITDTDRLNFVLRLLNIGGTSNLGCISPEVCCDWERSLIDEKIVQTREFDDAKKRATLNELVEKRKRLDVEIANLQK